MERLSFRDDQQRLLQDLCENVKKNGFFMRAAIDKGNLREALKYSALMLAELRTGDLYPQKYYELYMTVFDQLRHLEAFFPDAPKMTGAAGITVESLSELYDMVQNAGQVLPRMYLMCTVGAVWMREDHTVVPFLLKDLVETCKGIQHPTRGLFLRAYLLLMARPMLPSCSVEFPAGPNPSRFSSPSTAVAAASSAPAPAATPDDAGDAAAAKDGSPAGEAAAAGTGEKAGTINGTQISLNFLLTNFTEMNKLWVRMQLQGTLRDKDKRERERRQLSDLVGKNLTHISQLDGLNLEKYKTAVLPVVLEQVISCKDAIAQQYLMQCLVQVFPDEFHLGTLDTLLGACSGLHPAVSLNLVLRSLLDRLASACQEKPEILAQCLKTDAFIRLRDATQAVALQQQGMAASQIVAMFAALTDFARVVHPGQLEVIDGVLQSCTVALSGSLKPNSAAGASAAPAAGKVLQGDGEAELVELLSRLAERCEALALLQLRQLSSLMALLPPRSQREMAMCIGRCILRSSSKVAEVWAVNAMMDLVAPLLAPPASGRDGGDADSSGDESEQQVLLAQLMHCLEAAECDLQMQLLRSARERLLQGSQRFWHAVLMPLAFGALRLVRRLTEGGGAAVAVKAALEFLNELCGVLEDVNPMVALRGYLAAAHAASEEAREAEFAEAFVEQACVMLDERLEDESKVKVGLYAIIGTLQRLTVFGPEVRDRLVSITARHCSKLLKRSDQCTAVCACSHLFWQQPSTGPAAGAGSTSLVQDGEGVKSLLSRATRTATQAAKAVVRKKGDINPLVLFVIILNTQLYYLDKGSDFLNRNQVENLVQLIENDKPIADEAISTFYYNTLQHVRRQKTRSDEVGERYSVLDTPVLLGPDRDP